MLQRILLTICVAFTFATVGVSHVEARQDVYAYTYNGNNWFVDRDSINGSMPDGTLHFNVYTQVGLVYHISAGAQYYNADVFYGDQKLSSERGQIIYKNPAVLASTRVARQLRNSAAQHSATPQTTTQQTNTLQHSTVAQQHTSASAAVRN